MKIMKTTFPGASVVITLLAAQPVAVCAEWSGLVAVASDYVWRGISQTDDGAALIGEIDYTHDSGFYAGIWGSNVDFGPGDPSVEIDVYAGFSGETADGVRYDAGILHYAYPGAGELETEEFHVGAGYAIADIAVHYTDDYFGSGADAWYVEANAEIPLPHTVSLLAHAGRSDGSHFDAPGNIAYTDYSVGVRTERYGLTADLTYSDTNLDRAECGGDICDGRVVLTLSKAF